MTLEYDFNDDEFEYEIDTDDIERASVELGIVTDRETLHFYYEDWMRLGEEHERQLKEHFQYDAYERYQDTVSKDKDVYSYYGMSRSDFRWVRN